MAWRFLDFQRHNAFENMAIDEAILFETISKHKPPTVRFYGWKPAAVSIGYFQSVEKEVNLEKCRLDGIDVVRRISGGKAVFHCEEVTYSVIACNTEKLFPPDILGTYSIISRCLARGLACLGIEASLAKNGRNLQNADFPASCFSMPSRNELLVSGRKICGSAQMRTGSGFIQHGSLLVNFDPFKTASFLLPVLNGAQLQKLKNSVAAINEELSAPVDEKGICTALKNGFSAVLDKEITEDILTPAEQTLASRLIGKYENLEWNHNKKQKPFTMGDQN